MTYKEENIVNIAMRAAELLKDGRIERDELTGHAGLTESIITLADAFEKQNAGVDFNAGDRDYWLEIDAFAEEKLLEMYGRQPEHESNPLEVKVIIDSGIVHAVLKNQQTPVNVEIVDVDSDYENYDALDNYRNALYKDKTYSACDFTVARFTEDELQEEHSGPLMEAPVTVFAKSAGGARINLMSGDYDQCNAYCDSIGWLFKDGNGFEWDLEIEDSREASFPRGYYDAVTHYCDLAGADIECEFVRQHADKLVCCYGNNLDYADFVAWVKCEKLLNTELSLDEYSQLEQACAVTSVDDNTLWAFSDKLRETVAQIREGNAPGPAKESLDDLIAGADTKKTFRQSNLPGKETVPER